MLGGFGRTLVSGYTCSKEALFVLSLDFMALRQVTAIETRGQESHMVNHLVHIHQSTNLNHNGVILFEGVLFPNTLFVLTIQYHRHRFQFFQNQNDP